jgi:hypothetical protein
MKCYIWPCASLTARGALASPEPSPELQYNCWPPSNVADGNCLGQGTQIKMQTRVQPYAFSKAFTLCGTGRVLCSFVPPDHGDEVVYQASRIQAQSN